MKASAAELLRLLPGPVSEKWFGGEPFVSAFAHGTMSVEIYAPVGSDTQGPHLQDELYFIHAGSGSFACAGEEHSFAAGDCFFVPAGTEHRFTRFTAEFAAWVVFWGPEGGE